MTVGQVAPAFMTESRFCRISFSAGSTQRETDGRVMSASYDSAPLLCISNSLSCRLRPPFLLRSTTIAKLTPLPLAAAARFCQLFPTQSHWLIWRANSDLAREANQLGAARHAWVGARCIILLAMAGVLCCTRERAPVIVSPQQKWAYD